MKKTIKQIILLWMAISLIIISMPTIIAAKDNTKRSLYTEDGYEIEFSILSQWESGFEGKIIITNTGKEAIENWTLEFDFDKDISRFWTAKIIEHSGLHYKIKHNGWNSVIKPGQSINLGLEGKPGNVTSEPTNYKLNVGKISRDTQERQQQIFGKQDVDDRMKLVSLGDKPLKIEGEKINIFEDIYSNSDINVTADYIRGYYKGNAVGKINLKGKDTEWKEKTETSAPVKAADNLLASIKEETKEIQDLKVYNKKVTIKEDDASMLDSIMSSDEIIISGIEIDLPKLLYSKNDIKIDGCGMRGEQEDFTIVSEKGNIKIKADNCFFMGYIYAPEGKVTIEAENVTFFGSIIAKEIYIKGKTCNFANISLEMDYDEDFASDWKEFDFGTDPANKDTDGDGLLDGFEINYYTELSPLKEDTDGNGVLDGEEDFDEDCLTNLKEQEYGTDPFSADTDEDNLTDNEEIEKYKTLPYEEDTDGDGINDGDEVALNLNPLNKNTYGVPDKEYETEQIITKEDLSLFNQDNSYELQIKVKATGNANTQMDIMESRYDESLEAFGGFIGKTLSIQYEDEFSINEMELSFKLHEETMNKLPKAVINDKGLKGIKRLQIFHYDERKGTLYPIKTSYNSNSKTLKASVKQIGEYFVVDLQQWFYELGLNNLEKKEKNKIVNKSAFSISKKEKNKNKLAKKEEKAKKQMALLKNKKKSAESKLTIGNQQADIVFLIDSSKSMKQVIGDYKKNIGILWDMLYEAHITPRIAILELNKESVDGANIYSTENGRPWAVSKKQANTLMKSVKIGGTGTINQIDGLEAARNLSFRKNAKKYFIMITDQGIAKNQENVSGIKNIKEITKKLKNDNISTSIVCPEEEEKQFLDLAKSTKGICVDLLIDFYTNLYEWIVVTKDEVVFQAILPDKLMLYSCNVIPSKNNKKRDTDKDGLADSEEIDWTLINGTGANMKLPSWNTYMKKKQVEGKEDFKRLSEENKKKILSLPVLPLHSNLLFKDSDGDEIYDTYDETPLWHEFIMSELGGNSLTVESKKKAEKSYLNGVGR